MMKNKYKQHIRNKLNRVLLILVMSAFILFIMPGVMAEDPACTEFANYGYGSGEEWCQISWGDNYDVCDAGWCSNVGGCLASDGTPLGNGKTLINIDCPDDENNVYTETCTDGEITDNKAEKCIGVCEGNNPNEYYVGEDAGCYFCPSDGEAVEDNSGACDYGCVFDLDCQFGEYCNFDDSPEPAGQYSGSCVEGCNDDNDNCDPDSTEPICGGVDVCVGCLDDNDCVDINGGTCSNDGSCTLDENWEGCTGYWGEQIEVDEYEDTPCSYMGYESEEVYPSMCLGNDEWDDSASEGMCGGSECNEEDVQEYACDGSEGSDYVWAECVNGYWDSSSGYSNYADSCYDNACEDNGQMFPEGDYPGIDCGDGSGGTYTAVCSAGEWDWSDWDNNCGEEDGYCGDGTCSDYEWSSEWCAEDCNGLYCEIYPEDKYCNTESDPCLEQWYIDGNDDNYWCCVDPIYCYDGGDEDYCAGDDTGCCWDETCWCYMGYEEYC
jgi:hypothetical protein